MPDISWEVLIKFMTGFITLATGLAGLLKSDKGQRAAVLEEAEILKNLPEGSDAHKELQSLLEKEVMELANRRSWKRDWLGAIISVICAPSLGYLALWLIQQKTWWGWILAAPMILFTYLSLFLLFESVQLRSRDNRSMRER